MRGDFEKNESGGKDNGLLREMSEVKKRVYSNVISPPFIGISTLL